ncbi:nucleoside triphosphate pyrophosphohydrolase [Lysinibacillus cavernae]|uniref:nucleoside triphosphate pyrophosphohydrolase n=1 Tax=Lysinibacillus cavernae TaxID=2666135 RepID=UPI0012DA0180|nr:nucleoside triphosphate pyrophosphohydrolase [Lysinibacillus cavernae]
MPVYNKLVRDKILDIIQAKGLNYHARTLEPSELLKAIKAKMIEEASEFQEANDRQENMEELADILELIHTAISVLGVSYEELDAIRERKKIIRGGFENGIYLIDVGDQ